MSKAVYIEWLDHVGYTGRVWFKSEDIDNKPMRLSSIGFIVKEDDKCITLAGTDDAENDTVFGQVHTIMKNSILKKKRISI